MLAGAATSSFKGLAPSASSCARPAASRAVAITVSFAARYWRTNSRPMPRGAPGTMFFRGSDESQPPRRAFAATDAQRRDPALAAARLQRMQQRHHDPRPRRADRMTERTGAAIHVDDVVRELQ